MQLYLKTNVDKIISSIQNWDNNPNSNSNCSSLKKSLVNITRNSINGDKLVHEELINFKENNPISKNDTKALDTLIKTYEKVVSIDAPVEVYQDAKEVLKQYISDNLSLAGQEKLNTEIDGLSVVKIKIKEVNTTELDSFKEKNLIPELQPEFSRVTNRAIARNTNGTIDTMTDYFISECENFLENSPEESLKALYKKRKSEDVPVMTFAEAVNKYNRTNNKEWNTVDTLYFKLKIGDKTEIIFLNGTGYSMPKTKEEALTVRNGLKEGLYKREKIEVIVGDELNANNVQNHKSAIIIDDSLDKSGQYKVSKWCNNLFVKGTNGGSNGLKELAEGYGYTTLGSYYEFIEVEEGFSRGCPVRLYGNYSALNASYVIYNGQFRG